MYKCRRCFVTRFFYPFYRIRACISVTFTPDCYNYCKTFKVTWIALRDPYWSISSTLSCILCNSLYMFYKLRETFAKMNISTLYVTFYNTNHVNRSIRYCNKSLLAGYWESNVQFLSEWENNYCNSTSHGGSASVYYYLLFCNDSPWRIIYDTEQRELSRRRGQANAPLADLDFVLLPV